jgi:hypothetical protein
MRQYYASDKKKREDAKRKQKEEKRLRRLNKAPTTSPEAEPGTDPASNTVLAEAEVPTPGPKS